MAHMLGGSKPFDLRSGNCCKRHGRESMTPKRMREEREWRAELDAELVDPCPGEPEAADGQAAAEAVPGEG